MFSLFTDLMSHEVDKPLRMIWRESQRRYRERNAHYKFYQDYCNGHGRAEVNGQKWRDRLKKQRERSRKARESKTQSEIDELNKLKREKAVRARQEETANQRFWRLFKQREGRRCDKLALNNKVPKYKVHDNIIHMYKRSINKKFKLQLPVTNKKMTIPELISELYCLISIAMNKEEVPENRKNVLRDSGIDLPDSFFEDIFCLA